MPQMPYVSSSKYQHKESDENLQKIICHLSIIYISFGSLHKSQFKLERQKMFSILQE